METVYVRTGNEEYREMARFWGKLFLVNFALGVVTGITLEFQFGTNWSRYSRYVGDIFGSILAIEATLAFFLESTFLAVWHFGWNRLSPRLHALSIWLVALASNLSALWIIIANAWMQHPVGFTIRNGRAELTDFWAVVSQPFAIQQYLHTISGAYILTGFVIMGVSAYHLLRRQHLLSSTNPFGWLSPLPWFSPSQRWCRGITTAPRWRKSSPPSWRPWNPIGRPRPGRPCGCF